MRSRNHVRNTVRHKKLQHLKCVFDRVCSIIDCRQNVRVNIDHRNFPIKLAQ